MVTKTPKHVVKKIDGIVRQIVQEEMPDGLSMEDVCVVAHEDPFGDESVFIYVVYGGDPNEMDLDWAVALPRRVMDQLSSEEMPTIPLKRLIHKSEWPKFYRYNVEPWIPATS